MSKPASGSATPEIIETGASPTQLTQEKINEHPSLASTSGALQVEKGSGSARASRQNSPARLPSEFILKYQTQLTRLAAIQVIADELPKDLNELALNDIESELGQLEAVFSEFSSTHKYFETNWPATFITHEYFSSNVFQKGTQLHRQTFKALSRAKTAALARLPQPTPISPTSQAELKLPDIKLKQFTGEYADWPRFKEMFESLIMNNARIQDIQRLLYLRSCLTGSAAELIATFPLAGSSLQPSWETLNTRYENNRLLIKAQFDKVCNLERLTKKSAKGVEKIINTLSEARKTLKSMKLTIDLLDAVFVYQGCDRLDPNTREAWENSIASSREFPTFEKLEEFLNARVRAMEHVEAAAPQPSQGKTQQGKKSATAHQGTTQQGATQTNSRAYECDCCKGNHFIVSCPNFRAMNVVDRRIIVKENRLCYNCLGRHSVNSCKSTQKCKTCGGKHHTMLHETNRSASTQPKETSQPSSTSAPH